MGLFTAMHTSGTGLSTFRTWIDAVSHNIANLGTARSTSEEAFRAQYVQAAAVDYGAAGHPGVGGGVEVVGIAEGNPEGRLVYDPSNPLADGDGMVRMPDIDLGDQMTQLIAAQRGYQANLAVIERARESYAQAIGIGK